MTIAIVGYSRFGQLWADILKPFGRVVVFNRSDKAALASRAGVEFWRFNKLDEISKADLVFFAVSISSFEEVIEKTKPHLKKTAIVADVCSVKAAPCRLLKEYLRGFQTIGTHPMFGPDSAKGGLRGRQIVVCPLEISKANIKNIKKIFLGLGLKIVEMTPLQHDRQSAYSLALVQFLGRALVGLPLGDIHIRTLGFEYLLEIKANTARDSLGLFYDLERFNPYAREARHRLISRLEKIDRQIETK